METYIAGILFNLVQLWANHAGKPPGWTPSQEDIAELLAKVDAATPEARKAASRERLGLPPDDTHPPG